MWNQNWIHIVKNFPKYKNFDFLPYFLFENKLIYEVIPTVLGISENQSIEIFPGILVNFDSWIRISIRVKIPNPDQGGQNISDLTDPNPHHR